MTLVSTKEFNTHQEKYFDMAVNGNVCIQRGENMFYLSYAPFESPNPEQPILEPDDDLRRAITMDEFLIGVKEDLREIFRKGKG
jgi:Ca2+-binding EF-hand superfamily protein